MLALCQMTLFEVSLFVCFKQKTAYDMRISDWSSDVCSSDLPNLVVDRLEASRGGQHILRIITRIVDDAAELRARRKWQADTHEHRNGKRTRQQEAALFRRVHWLSSSRVRERRSFSSAAGSGAPTTSAAHSRPRCFTHACAQPPQPTPPPPPP